MKNTQRRFRVGWGLAWGIAAVVAGAVAPVDSGTSATVHAGGGPAGLSDSARLAILLAGCGLAAGVGVYVALKALRISASDRRWSAVMWAAIGAATAAANWYLAGRDGSWMAHLALTLPVAGGAGGLAQCLATTTAAGTRRMVHAAVWTALWAVAFLFARYVGVIAVYLSLGMMGDLSDALNLRLSGGEVLSTFIGGYLTGLLVGTLLSFSPGIAWQEPAPRPAG